MVKKRKNQVLVDFLIGILIGLFGVSVFVTILFTTSSKEGILAKINTQELKIFANIDSVDYSYKGDSISSEDPLITLLKKKKIDFDYLETTSPNFPPNYYKIIKDKKEGLIYIKDNYVQLSIPIEYDALISYYHNLIKVKQQNRFGLISLEDKIIIPIEYHFILENKPIGYFQLGKDGQWGLMTEKGQIITPIQYTAISEHFTEGLLQVEKDFKYGFINQNGIEIIPPTYDVVFGDFQNGKVKVALNNKKFYINTYGVQVK